MKNQRIPKQRQYCYIKHVNAFSKQKPIALIRTFHFANKQLHSVRADNKILHDVLCVYIVQMLFHDTLILPTYHDVRTTYMKGNSQTDILWFLHLFEE